MSRKFTGSQQRLNAHNRGMRRVAKMHRRGGLRRLNAQNRAGPRHWTQVRRGGDWAVDEPHPVKAQSLREIQGTWYRARP